MRVISKGNLEEPNRITCGSCGSELEYTPEDVEYSGSERYITCPVCGMYVSVNKDEDDYIGYIPVYPKDGENDFYFFDGGYDLSEDEINKYIHEIVDDYNSTPTDEVIKNGFYSLRATGNGIVFACVLDNALQIYVCNGYAEGEYYPENLN